MKKFILFSVLTLSLFGCGGGSGTPSGPGGTVVHNQNSTPSLITIPVHVNPIDGAINVARNQQVQIDFQGFVAVAYVNGGFTVDNQPGIVSSLGGGSQFATFTPTGLYPANTTLPVDIDVVNAQNQEVKFHSSFTTGL